MVNFTLSNPTTIVFGRGAIDALSEHLPADCRVLLLYGGGSIKHNGIYDRVAEKIGDRPFFEFGGIEVNPHYETILNAAQLAREKQVDFILAVGGGSVIDAAKFLAAVVACPESDPWGRLRNEDYPDDILPVGVVLTLPATGSESNPVSVITSTTRHLKVPFSSDRARPAFALLDPDTMLSLSKHQLANGVVDAFTHVLEQYVTEQGNTPIQYGYCEAILGTLIEWGPILLEHNSLEARENTMWAANQALNGLIGSGVRQDWSTHMIGHALTEIYGIDHARSLSVIMPSLYRFKFEQKKQMLARYGRRVWELTDGDDAEVAMLAINRTEAFFAEMGTPISPNDLGSIVISADDVVAHLERANQTGLGEHGDIGPHEVVTILGMAKNGADKVQIRHSHTTN